MPPGTAANKHRAHPRRPSRQYVVIEPITHIQDGLGRNVRLGNQPGEERGIRLGDTPCRRGSHEIRLQPGRCEHLLDALRLVTGDADDQPHPTYSCDALQRIGIQITLVRVDAERGAIDTKDIP